MDFLQFLLDKNNIFIVVVALASGAMLLVSGLRKGRGGSAVDTTTAIQMVNHQNAVWVDVRAAEQFQAGHIAQARSVPADDLEKKAAALPKNKPLILVCEQGRTSPRIAQRLKALGLTDVKTLDGGMRAWYAANLPVTQKG
ncbi:rhodanese-like domain-containing protein [Bordetella holmesii]|uniref:Rhodanese-like protein n=2 Tax=Bordetella holmesii TaxID=35814 RepID=A0A158M4F5_9BORD|nr:rhodanese-like domain-containing protein [Bordetella holmesii]AHV92528.1 rhodanese-like domain protein [Bordetella holmesii ATCC 51541]AIT25814.1 rhodanese-like domain protein [Bordetella holmesii 44057]EWM42712.1 rhodanese-like domain protein [Bordetella holmesii 41130]EWM46381.1 rhodanese-like domain protein [Bordetella holmesii 35009]EWM50543.1 rhodanese-like domain protein [Bordetella holmesii 70147]